jgi:heme/copper-type cytochrome/quinol oxidase subunit 2
MLIIVYSLRFGLIAVSSMKTVTASSFSLSVTAASWQSISNLHTTVLWIATAIFLVVNGLLIYSLIRFRRKSAPDSKSDPRFHGNAILEAIWILIPVGILIALLILTFQTLQ